MNIESWQVYIGLVINGIFTGFGAALGTYIATQHAIKGATDIKKTLTRNWKPE